MKVIEIERVGGPEVLSFRELSTPEPSGDQVRVRVEAAGVNFIDTYQRSGRYPLPLPFIPGQEGAGVVEAVGPDVNRLDLAPGVRVGWAMAMGSYGTHALIPADRLVPLPEAVSTGQAAAALLQGMTVHALTESTFPLRAGHTVLIHAAAGGVGLLLTQRAHQLGARVLATVSTEAKAALAREAGADEVILYSKTDFAQEVARLTAGRGVNVVYDSVGKSTFDGSLSSLSPLGMLVLFGGASGPVPPFDPMLLNQKGSLFLTRPKLQDYIADRATYARRANDVLEWVQSGKVQLRIGHTYPLVEAAQAHRDLEARSTTGKLLLLP